MVILSHYNNSNKSTLAKCPGCNNERAITDPDSGEVICSKCGRVLSDKLLEMGPEWRTFAADETEARARTGMSESQLVMTWDYQQSLEELIEMQVVTNLIQLCV